MLMTRGYRKSGFIIYRLSLLFSGLKHSSKFNPHPHQRHRHHHHQRRQHEQRAFSSLGQVGHLHMVKWERSRCAERIHKTDNKLGKDFKNVKGKGVKMAYLLGIKTNDERRNIDDLFSNTDVSLTDEYTGVVNRFGETWLEDLSLESSLHEIFYLEGEYVIETHAGLV